VGNVTVPANQPIPAKGAVIEVKYLYAYPGGALFQPVCLGVRDDVATEACTIAQLKYKAADGEAES
jgi:bifunctional non-homologous end joining protein LigD